MQIAKNNLVKLLLFILLFALVACGGNQTTTEPAEEEPAVETAEETAEEAAEEEAAEEESMEEEAMEEEAAEEEMEEEAMEESMEDVELRMTWYTDGNEDVVMRELLDRFEAENPGHHRCDG